MAPDDESRYFEELKAAYASSAQDVRLPLEILVLYLDGQLSEHGRALTETYLARSAQARSDLEMLKQIREEEAAHLRDLESGHVRAQVPPTSLVARIRSLQEAAQHQPVVCVCTESGDIHEVPVETLVPGWTYRIDDVSEGGAFVIRYRGSVLTFECTYEELYVEYERFSPAQAADTDSDGESPSVRTERSADGLVKVRIHAGSIRADGSRVLAHFEISVSN